MLDKPNTIFRKNPNQETAFTVDQARENTKASIGRGTQFSPENIACDKEKPIVIVGGGSTQEFESIVSQRGGLDSVHIITAGSATLRADKEAQEEAGYPYLDRVDAAFFNQVDIGEELSYYKNISKVAEKAIQNDVLKGAVYLSSYSGSECFDAFPDDRIIRVEAFVKGDELSNEESIAMGSSAPTAALAVSLLEGRQNIDFVGVTAGGIVEKVPEGEELSKRLPFNQASKSKVGADQDLYTEFSMEPRYQKIKSDNAMEVYAGENYRAVIPRNYWYQLQELKSLVDFGRQNGVSINVHGEGALTKLLLMDNVELTVSYDSQGEFQPGTKLVGSKPLGSKKFQTKFEE